MKRFADTAEAIAGTNSKLKKVAALADYFRALPDSDLQAAGTFFTGRPFAQTDARTLKVGWSALSKAIHSVSKASDDAMRDAYMKRGDMGEAAELLFQQNAAIPPIPSQVRAQFDELATLSKADKKLALITGLLSTLGPREAKYVIKMITGELRIGLKENTVEEAIARAFDQPAAAVRRVNMILGDIGETATLARAGTLHDVSLRMFRPVKSMLATPIENEDEVYESLPGAFLVEDKYDGIRAQLHVEQIGRAHV